MDNEQLLKEIDSAIKTLNKAKKILVDELQPKLFTLEQLGDKPDTEPKEDGTKVAVACYKVLQYEFSSYYNFWKETPFIWSPKENKAIKEIVTKIKITLKSAELPFTVENVKISFQILVKDIDKVDEFTFKNFSPSMINSRYNQIVANLKELRKKDYSEELKEKLKDDNNTSWI